MVKVEKSLIFFVVISFLIYYGGQLIIRFVDFQNARYAFFFGGDHVILSTPQGSLKGFTSVSRDKRTFYEFLGIPYAVPPIGELRFESPIAFPAWTGTRDALGYGNKCLQYDFLIRMIVGDEDCLTLNVHTPSKIVDKSKSRNEKLLPVLVFIYGGMFMFGRTEIYRPQYLMDEDVVLVTVNYRLAAFGFLTSGDEVVRGNMGLKDQVLALKWIRQNIQSFGGDPNCVAIWGESAGGSAVHHHMLSPQSKGLFHRGISMSGTVLNHWSLTKKPREQFEHFGRTFNCPTEDKRELLKCLKSVDAATIASSFEQCRDILHDRLWAYAPTIETVNDKDSFLTEDPKVILKQGKIMTNVPWLTGVNDMEGLIYAGDCLLNKTCSFKLSQNWSKYAPILWDFENTFLKTRTEMSKQLWNFYLKDHETFQLYKTLNNLTAVFSDINFYKPLRDTLKLQSKLSSIFLYYYNYEADNGLAQVFMNMPGLFPVVVDGLFGQLARIFWHNFLGFEEKNWGACHTDELGLLFQLPTLLNRVEETSVDYNFSKYLAKQIVHFAKHGTPMEKEWTAVTAEKPLRFMRLNKNLQMIHEPFTERVEFILNLFKEAGLP